MAHLHPINEQPDSTPQEDRGDIEDYIVLCSDYCHQSHCDNSGGSLIYEGFYGCQEISITEPCAECGATVYGIDTYVNGEYVDTQDNWNTIETLADNDQLFIQEK
jgi:hypothetical protein